MDLSLLFIFLVTLLPEVSTKSECMQVIGILVCPQRPVLAGNVQIDLIDEDSLPWEADDQMGRTWSLSNGSFMLSGCGADLGPFNEPDPYVIIKHRCPSVLWSALQNKNVSRKTQFALTKTFMPKLLNLGRIYLDDSDA